MAAAHQSPTRMAARRRSLPLPKGKRIVVAVDGSALSSKGFDVACALRQFDDAVLVVHIADPSKHDLPPDLKPEYIKSHFEVNCVSRIPRGHFCVNVYEKEKHGEPARTMMAHVVAAEKADFIVVGTHGRKGPKSDDTILGSTTDFSLRQMQCTTVVTKPQWPVPEGALRIAVVMDGSQRSNHACEVALHILGPKEGSANELHLLHFYGPEADQQTLERMSRKCAALVEADSRVRFVHRETRAVVEELDKYVAEENCDFLVVGADGMRSYMDGKRYLASVSDTCVRKVRCHVVVTNTPEAEAD